MHRSLNLTFASVARFHINHSGFSIQTFPLFDHGSLLLLPDHLHDPEDLGKRKSQAWQGGEVETNVHGPRCCHPSPRPGSNLRKVLARLLFDSIPGDEPVVVRGRWFR